MNNFAYIDGQNLHSGVSAQRWKLDHKKFREYMRDELDVTKAFIFLGFMEEHQDLYNALQEAGFILFFKPLVRYDDGQIKGNVDADMVLKVMVDVNEYDQAVIVSGDGDFAGLLRHLAGVKKLKKVIIPNKDTYSSLFKRMDEFDKGSFIFIRDLKTSLQYLSLQQQRQTQEKGQSSASEGAAPKKSTSQNSSTTKQDESKAPTKSKRPHSRRTKTVSKSRNSGSNTTAKTSVPMKARGLLPKKKQEANLLSAIEESNK